MKLLPCLALSVVLVLGAPVARAQDKAKDKPAEDPESFFDLPSSTKPIAYTSNDGQFSATFPPGCGRLRTRTNVAADGTADVAVHVAFVNCERENTVQEGCLVTAKLGAAAGLKNAAAVDMVTGEITKLLGGYAVKPFRQTPVHRDFGKHGVAEGLDVQARSPSGGGDVWIRGLLRGDDIYLLVAWKAAGGLWDDAAYPAFFDSFRPWVD